MRVDDGISDWFRVCVMAAIMCVLLFGIGHCSNEDWKKRKQFAKDNPVEAAKNNCHTKVRGSRPACWTEGDKIIFNQLLKEQIRPIIKEVIQEEFANHTECHQYGR